MTIPLEGHRVDGRGEEVAIFWNAQKGYENHIRKINMNTTSGAVAFIVPLPSLPNVYEVENSFFDQLSNYVESEREVVEKPDWKIGTLPFFVYFFLNKENLLNLIDRTFGKADAVFGSKNILIANSVTVLQDINIAGFNVKTILATDLGVLERWLIDNEFPLNQGHMEWLNYYVQKKWTLTVFKFIQSGRVTHGFKTKTIGLGFKTDKAFHPYREPKKLTNTNKALNKFRVYYFSDNMGKAKLENSQNWGENTLIYSNQFDGNTRVFKGLPVNKKQGYWLTIFNEERGSRGDDSDIFFLDNDSNLSQNKLIPKYKRYDFFFPLELIFFGGFFYIRRKKYEKKSRGRKVLSISIWYSVFFILASVLGIVTY